MKKIRCGNLPECQAYNFMRLVDHKAELLEDGWIYRATPDDPRVGVFFCKVCTNKAAGNDTGPIVGTFKVVRPADSDAAFPDLRETS